MPELLTILLPLKFHDYMSNGSKVIALTNKPKTHPQTDARLLKTIPPSLRYRCAGGKTRSTLAKVV